MLVGLLTTLLVLDGLLLVLFILIQKGKGNMGLGVLGGGAQTLFGGSGGQDLFQKITWVLGGIFMAGSLGLSILKSREVSSGGIVTRASARTNLPISRPVDQAQQSQPVQQEVPLTTQQEVPVSQVPAGDVQSKQ
jgi:preprotein translocase subunit SecG